MSIANGDSRDRGSGAHDLRGVLLPVASALLLAALSAAFVTSGSPLLRTLLAIVVAIGMIALFDLSPRAGILAMFGYLPIVALLRRMLIPAVGWTVNDPLLLVAPVVATVLCVRLFVYERRRPTGDRLSFLVCALLAMVVLASLNPRNGSLTVGLGGLLFLGTPMLWFFVGREMGSRAAAENLLKLLLAAAAAIAAYGFFQSLVTLPVWDRAWVEIAGYGALFLERDVPNTFGTFASTAEYTLFMGAATVTAVSFALYGRLLALLVLPLVLPALFLSSNRSGFVFTLAAVCAIILIRYLRPRFVLPALVVLVAVIAVASPWITARLQSGAAATDNARVEYQLSGLGDPLNREQSTVTLHAELFIDGVRQGMVDPVGRGSGVTNNAVRRFGPGGENAAGYSNTEIDISNAFVSFGIVGGFIFIALFVVAMRSTARAFRMGPGPVPLAIIGIVAANFGHWLSGGHYAVTPMIWLLLGFTAASLQRSHAVAARDVETG